MPHRAACDPALLSKLVYIVSQTPPLPLKTAVIIVNYGTAELAIAATQSVLDRAAPQVAIHLVDNASPGGDAAILTQAHEAKGWGGRVTLYLEQENHGFGRGNNVVLQALAADPSPPDAVLLLNPDAELETDVLSQMAQVLAEHPDVAMVGAGISKPDGTPVTAAFRFPNSVNTFAAQLGLGPITRLLKHWQVPLPPDHPAGAVDWVAGAALLCRMQTLRALDFFDPAFFLYFEEVDLMRRANRAGWKTHYLPQARVIHAEGAATGVKSGQSARKRRPAYWYDSWQMYHRKTHGRFGAILAALAYLAGTAGHHVIATLRRRPISSPRNAFSDFWRYAMQPLLVDRQK